MIQDNSYSKWNVPIGGQSPPIQSTQDSSYSQWNIPVDAEDELRAEKPDIKTRLRMANIEGQQLSRQMLEPFGYKEKTSLARITESGFWKNILQNMGVQSREFIQSIPQLAESLQGLTPRGMATQAMQPPRYKSVLEPEGYRPPREPPKLGELPALESLRTAGELLTYMPKAGMEFMRDPVKFIEERPVDTLFLLEAIGIKPALGIRKRVKAGKSVRAGEIQNVINKVPDNIIPPEVKKVVRETLPKEKEISIKPKKPIPGQRQLDIQRKLQEKLKEKPPAKKQVSQKEMAARYDFEKSKSDFAKEFDAIEERLTGKKKATKDTPIRELHSGYPFSKEVKDSFKHLTGGLPGGVMVDSVTGSVGGIKGKVMKPPKPAKPPKIIKGERVELMLEPYTIPPAGEPLLVAKQKNKGTMPVYQHEISPFQQKPVKDIPFGKIKTDFTTSIRIFERYPPLKKTLYDPWKMADHKTFIDNRNIKKTVVPEWKKSVHESGISPGKSSDRIGNYLTSQSNNGPDILAAMGKKVVKRSDLTTAEIAILTDSRKQYDVFFVKVNNARKLAGQKPLKYERNYFPFMRNLDYLKKEGISLIVDDAAMVQKHLSGESFKYAIRRRYYKGKQLDIPIDLDFFKVFEEYAMSANKAINITPIVAKARTMMEDFKIETGGYTKKGAREKPIVWNIGQNTPKLRGWLTRWTDSLVDKTYIPSSPTAQLFAKGAAKLNKNIGIAILSMNARSAFIQWTALRNSLVALGEMRLVQGMVENLNPARRKFATENSFVLAGRKGNMDIHIRNMLDDSIKGKYARTKRAVAEVGMTPLQVLDIETARATWLGAHAKGKARGLTGRDLIVYADDTLTRTQASGRIGDVAQIQKTPVGRLATLFQTFTINEWGFIAQDALGIKNPTVKASQAMVNGFRLVYSTVLINVLFEGVFKIRSPFPAPEWAIYHAVQEGKGGKEITVDALRELGEQLPVFGGTIRYSTPYRTPLPAGAQVGVDAIALIRKLTTGDINKVSQYDIETLGKLLGIPGTSQVFKYLRRRKDGMSHIKAIMGVRTDVGTTGGRGRGGRGR